jgi:hypothetical protein
MGFGMANQMMQQGVFAGVGVGAGTPPPLPSAPAAAVAVVAAPVAVDILTPAQVAETLGVNEADVIATIEAGDLKAKKIGSAFRITRAALDEFLAQ